MRWVTSLLVALLGTSLEATLTPSQARQYFDEAEQLCRADHGRLWSVSLCGRLILVEPSTRSAAASAAVPVDGFLATEGIFLGTMPRDIGLASTSFDWNGERWTMVLWPLPDDPMERRILLGHELWHGIQDRIGFPSTFPANVHLDTLEGRLLLQLEWRALAVALKASSSRARRAAIADALAFRDDRYQRFAGAAEEERKLEMHEGLAEYTGVALASGSRRIRHDAAVGRLRKAEGEKSFVRSFAYASIPAWGLLLDQLGVPWRRGLGPAQDIAALARQRVAMPASQISEVEMTRRGARYNGEALRASEQRRDQERRGRLAEMRRRFIEGPLLRLPLAQMNMQFDPGTLQPFESFGTYYPQITLSDRWGRIEVRTGALISPDFTMLIVPAPPEPTQPLMGEGWQLDLADGWKVVAAERSGDFTLRRD